MARNDYKVRRSLKYRIKMWLYRLTRKDVERAAKAFWFGILEIVVCLLMFLMLFIIPGFFH